MPGCSLRPNANPCGGWSCDEGRGRGGWTDTPSAPPALKRLFVISPPGFFHPSGPHLTPGHLSLMACCKICCGCADCPENELLPGKCCCGGQPGECCQDGEYCCDGVCETDPCVCDDTPVTFTFATVTGQSQRSCDPQVKETGTITMSGDVPLPFTATVSWSADDDVEVNGTRLNVAFGSAGGCQFGAYCCASSGSGTMTFTSRSITVKLIDTVGFAWGGSVTITPDCPP